MKPQHLVLPVLAAVALGLGLPALAQQSGSEKKDTPPKEVKVDTTIKADGAPRIMIGGVADEKLQKVLKEALEFKGSDEEFAKKAAGWKKEHGVTVARKGQGHVVITREGKDGDVRIEVMRSGALPPSSRVSRTDVLRKDAEARELRLLAPKGADGQDIKIDLKSLKDMKPGDEREIKILKDIPLVISPNMLDGKEGVRVFRYNADGKEMTEKERAAIKKELQALRKKLRSLPKGEGRTFMFREGRPLSEKELKEMKEHMTGFEDIEIKLAPLTEGKALSEKQMKEMQEQMKGFMDLDIARIAPMAEGFAFSFGHGAEAIKGLSEADRKKMQEEIAKVHAEAQKKVAEITAKYKAKAKPAK